MTFAGRAPPSMSSKASAVAQHLADAAEAAGCQHELAAEVSRRGWLQPLGRPGELDVDDGDDDRAMLERAEARWRDFRVEQPRRAEDVKRFIAACCAVSADGRATGGELYERYLAWAKKGATKWTLVQLSHALADNGFKRDPSTPAQGRKKVWLGIAVRPWKAPPV